MEYIGSVSYIERVSVPLPSFPIILINSVESSSTLRVARIVNLPLSLAAADAALLQ